MTQDQYDKIHTYLLDNGQQELAGHLDGLWQENQSLKAESTKTTPVESEPTSVEPSTNEKQPSSTDEDAKPHQSAQDFQDQASDSKA